MNAHCNLSYFLKGVMKMDDINLFGEHDKTEQQPDTEKNIPLTSSRIIGKKSNLEPVCEQETSFREKTQSTRLKVVWVKGLYQKLSKTLSQATEAHRFNNFELRDRKLYYRDKSNPLMNKWGKLRDVGVIAKILGKEGLHELSFDIPVNGKVTARQTVMLNRVKEKLLI